MWKFYGRFLLLETRQQHTIKSEIIALPIVAIILDVLALAMAVYIGFAAVEPIKNNSIFLILIAFALLASVGSVVLNIRNKKTVSWIAISLWLVVAVVSGAIVINQQQNLNNANRAAQELHNKSKKANDQFKWTFSNFEALTTGDTLTGTGGDTYDSIVAAFGEPQAKQKNAPMGDMPESMTVTWSNQPDSGDSSYAVKTVTLSFVKQDDGSFALTNKLQAGLE